MLTVWSFFSSQGIALTCLLLYCIVSVITYPHYCTFTGFQATWITFSATRPFPTLGIALRPRELPWRARLLADGSYVARVPLIVPSQRLWKSQSQANRALRSLRMQIEHSIGFQNVYASVISIFRHKRYFLSFVVSTCGVDLQSKRRKINHPQMEKIEQLSIDDNFVKSLSC